MYFSKEEVELPGEEGGQRQMGLTRGLPKSRERTGAGDGAPMSGSNSVMENLVSKSGWTVLSETEDGRRRKTLEEALASERGQFQRLWESLCVGMLMVDGVEGLKHVTHRRINTGRVD